MCRTWLRRRFPPPGEPVADLLAGGGVQGCGAGPGREPVAVGEPGDVADVGQYACGAGGPDAVDLHQRRASRGDRGLELGRDRLQLLVDRDQVAIDPGGDRHHLVTTLPSSVPARVRDLRGHPRSSPARLHGCRDALLRSATDLVGGPRARATPQTFFVAEQCIDAVSLLYSRACISSSARRTRSGSGRVARGAGVPRVAAVPHSRDGRPLTPHRRRSDR